MSNKYTIFKAEWLQKGTDNLDIAKEDVEKLAKTRDTWVEKIDTALKERNDTWGKRCENAEKALFGMKSNADTADTTTDNKFNIFWSNVNILSSALFSAPPVADVRRRLSEDQDKRPIAVAIEKAINYSVDTSDLFRQIRKAVYSYLGPGIGQAKIEYKADVDKDTGQITYQGCDVRYFHWKAFLWGKAKQWQDVPWVAFEHPLTRQEAIDQFGVTLDLDAEDEKSNRSVWELYDKETRQRLFISKHHEYPLEVVRDTLNLKQFFPCPQPMIANSALDKIRPKPDWDFYKSHSKTLDVLVGREQGLIEVIKAVGWYEKSLAGEIMSIASMNDGELKPVQGLAEKMGGIDGRADFGKIIATWPLEDKIQALTMVRSEIDATKEQIYEITGLADIVRGNSKASETATAQQIKGQWANVRLIEKQNTVNQFVREIFRLKAEIMAEHYEPETFYALSGVELDPNQILVMRDDMQRSFAIDVETDSTIQRDEEAERTGRLEMLSTATDYINTVLPSVQNGMLPADLAQTLLKTAVRSFKYGRDLEEAIEALPDTQQQLTGMMQNIQELQMQLEQLAGERDQLSQQLAEVNEREQAREDAKVQSEAQESLAEAEKDRAQAEKYRSEAITNAVTPIGPIGV